MTFDLNKIRHLIQWVKKHYSRDERVSDKSQSVDEEATQ